MRYMGTSFAHLRQRVFLSPGCLKQVHGKGEQVHGKGGARPDNTVPDEVWSCGSAEYKRDGVTFVVSTVRATNPLHHLG